MTSNTTNSGRHQRHSKLTGITINKKATQKLTAINNLMTLSD
jgi:hypothetical protein